MKITALLTCLLTISPLFAQQSDPSGGNTPSQENQLVTRVEVRAGAVNVTAVGRGWYDDTGLSNAANNNYIAGLLGGVAYRNFFIFEVPALAEGFQTTDAVLRLYMPGLGVGDAGDGYISLNAGETFVIGAVSTPVDRLDVNATGQVAVFEDLAAGEVYGTVAVSAADNGSFLEIVLNDAAKAALDEAAGGTIAFGGYLAGLGDSGADQLIFAFANQDGDPTLANINITTLFGVPTLSGAMLIVLLVSLCGGAVWMARRRRAVA